MKRAFSLLEIIIVIVVISIISSFVISKTSNARNETIKTKIKSEIALIRNSISKQKTTNILLKKESLEFLDEAEINKDSSKLFINILDFPLISTTKEQKKIGAWTKTSNTRYLVYISDEENLEFNFEDNSFVCKSSISLCSEYE